MKKIKKRYEIKYSNFSDNLELYNIVGFTCSNRNVDIINKKHNTNYDEKDHKEILSFFLDNQVNMDKVKYDVSININYM